jgi:hypothetical protein
VDALSAAGESLSPPEPMADRPPVESAVADDVSPDSKLRARGAFRGRARYLSPEDKFDVESLTLLSGQSNGQIPELQRHAGKTAEGDEPVRVLFVLEASQPEVASPASKAADR